MNGTLGTAFILIWAGAAAPAVYAQAGAWQELKSDHFIVYSAEGGGDFAGEAARRSETYYDDIAAWLGYARRGEFWTWDNRCRIYLYGSREDYIRETGQPAWSGGAAVLEKRTILSFRDAPDFLTSVLPHELAHLIFRDFTGAANGQVPLWLDEGIAMSQEKARRKEFDEWIAKMVKEKNWIPVKELMNVTSLQGDSGAGAVMFYAEAQSIVRFLVEKYGSERFQNFCRSLRDGAKPEEALEKNYPSDFPSLGAFEERWAASVAERTQGGTSS